MIAMLLTIAAFACRSRLHARAILLVLLGACAPELDTGTFSRHVGNRLAAGELAPAPEPKRARVELAPRAPEQLEQRDPILSLDAARCVGPWADNSDVYTRFSAHPDTGLCTFPCSRDPRCSGARCGAEYIAHLVLVCGELAGVCAAASDGRSYCEAAP